jgi:cytidylate kinase
MTSIPVITIDGPAGSGKGTLCRLLAQHLGWNMLDSGSTYRLLALAAKGAELDLLNEDALAALTTSLDITFDVETEGELKIYLGGDEATLAIRSEQCSQLASKLAAFPKVRLAMLEKQRAFCKPPGLVTDGRDMGTVVFPEACVKFFLVASPEKRAERRYNQLKEKGMGAKLPEILAELRVRDDRDQNRLVAPLKPAVGAVILDSSELSIEAVFEQAVAIVCGREKEKAIFVK